MIAELVSIVFGTLVSEDLTTIAAGLLVQRGQLPVGAALLACAAGIYVGDLGLWCVGRAVGPRILRSSRVAAVVPPGGAQRFREWFDAHTGMAIAGSRLAPGTRLPLYLAAGACRTSFSRFARWTFVVVAAWTPLLLGASVMAGQQLGAIAAKWQAASHTVLLAAGAVCVVAWQIGIRLLSRRGRQRLAARIARIWQWEFWPMWLFYAPVAAWTVWLALRHGGYGAIAAANPGMPDGGVVGESKFDILARLPRSARVPSMLIPASSDAGARIAALGRHMQHRGWDYPIVLKPDVGQRGAGVRVARSLADVSRYLSSMPGDVLVQPYHPGPFEAGIFYYRRPGAARGRILAVTDKHFPIVVGDGRSALEDLVWSNRRYRMQAGVFLERLGDRRHLVPAAGERVALGLAGNHAQGTMFTDGRHLITPALERRIDGIARVYDGFFIGRFDVRYSDREAFTAGEDLAIVELNGATAECTNIYDPANTLWSAYAQLFRQWSLVFEIGAANRRSGRSAATSARLIELVRGYLSMPVVFPVSD